MYASIEDVAAVLGREIDEGDPSAIIAIETASGLVAEFIGRDISQVVGEVEIIDGSGTNVLLLRYWPVHPDPTVKVLGEDEEDFEWAESGYLKRTDYPWPTELRSVEVTYTHGYNPLPTSVRTIVAQAAARLLETPGAVKQESIGGYSVTYTAGAVLQALDLMALERYRDR